VKAVAKITTAFTTRSKSKQHDGEFHRNLSVADDELARPVSLQLWSHRIEGVPVSFASEEASWPPLR
jgi:hypothetical protein